MLTSLPGGQIGFLVFVNAVRLRSRVLSRLLRIAFIVIPLLGPAAEHLGIDLIWFGVILGVNMQTSFMHPPFGFALFYLRSVAPRETFLDRVTGKATAGVTTGQIYWGAVPFVVIQRLMVAMVIMFPAMVTHYKRRLVHGRSEQGARSKFRSSTCRRSIFGQPPNSMPRSRVGHR